MIENLAPQVGLEPTTLRLTAECSTIELLRSNENSGLLSFNQTDFRSVKHCRNLTVIFGDCGVRSPSYEIAALRRFF
jgi:hypothetical protein